MSSTCSGRPGPLFCQPVTADLCSRCSDFDTQPRIVVTAGVAGGNGRQGIGVKEGISSHNTLAVGVFPHLTRAGPRAMPHDSPTQVGGRPLWPPAQGGRAPLDAQEAAQEAWRSHRDRHVYKETSCEPARRRFASHDLSFASSFCTSASDEDNCFGDDSAAFEFIPMPEEEPQSGQGTDKDVLVCEPADAGPGSTRMLISSELGYAVPRSVPSSGASSLRVSTSSFCSSQDTIVDSDSEYRSTSGRTERRKHFAEEIGASVAAAAAAGAEANPSGAVFSRRTSPQATRAARPPMCQVTSAPQVQSRVLATAAPHKSYLEDTQANDTFTKQGKEKIQTPGVKGRIFSPAITVPAPNHEDRLCPDNRGQQPIVSAAQGSTPVRTCVENDGDQHKSYYPHERCERAAPQASPPTASSQKRLSQKSFYPHDDRIGAAAREQAAQKQKEQAAQYLYRDPYRDAPPAHKQSYYPPNDKIGAAARAPAARSPQYTQQALAAQNNFYADSNDKISASMKEAEKADALWKERFGAGASNLLSTERYDYTVKLALWKIQKYR